MNLNQITVAVTDVEKSIEFYEILGLRLIVKSLPNYARFECPEGNATFSLHQTDASSNESNVWIYFEVNNVDEYVGQLIAKGIQFEEMPNDKPWLWRESRLKDLDNNQIIIYHAGDKRKNPPWRIG
jgi:catechol 2,3-dioxygenase-like lactoylglutathione lyase family enzyme